MYLRFRDLVVDPGRIAPTGAVIAPYSLRARLLSGPPTGTRSA